MQAACNMLLEISQQGLQHYFRPHRNQRSTRQVMRPQNCGNPNETKSHLDVALVERRIVYYKGEGGVFPPSPGHGESCVSKLPMARPSTKSAPIMH